MTDYVISYVVAAVIIWVNASSPLELAVGVGGSWTLMTGLLLLR